MALTLSGTNGVVGAGFTLDSSGASVTAGVGTFGSLRTENGRVRVTGPSTITNNAQTIVAIDSADDNTAGLGGKIGFAAKVNETTRTLAAVGGLKSIAGTGNFSGDLALYTRRNGVANLDERLRIVSDGKVGIGTTNPTTALDVNGLIKSGAPSFSARRNTTQNLATGTEAVIIFNSEDHDTDDAYDTSTGEFTVPAGKGGVYQINAHIGIDDLNSGFLVRLRVFKNGSQFYGMRAQNVGAATNTIVSAHINATATLAAGDVIKCMGFQNDTEGAQPIEIEANGFSMFRLSI